MTAPTGPLPDSMSSEVTGLALEAAALGAVTASQASEPVEAPEPVESPDRAESPAGLSHRQLLVVFSGLMLGMLLAALDQTIVATALPTIVAQLHGVNHLSWVVSGYLLAATVTTPLYGKLSDQLGRKGIFQLAIVIFLVGSALSGLSQNMGELIAFRTLQGLGAGGLISLAMAIIGDLVSPRERGRYQGYFGGVFAFASVMGPLAGGFFTEHLGWRWVFYINVPIGILALVVTSSVLRLPFRRLPHHIDYLGSALLVGGVTSLLLVTVWGGSQYAWGSGVIIGLLAAGVAIMIVFFAWERRASEPLLPPRLFRNDIFNVSGGIAFLQAMAMFGAIIFVPFYLQLADGVSVTTSGLLLLPLMAGILTMSIGSGRLVARTGRYKIYPVVGGIFMTAGMLLFTLLDTSTTRPLLSLYMVVLGMGMGLMMQIVVLATQNSIDPKDMGTATSSIIFFRSLGGVFGAAFFGAIFVSRLQHWLTLSLPAGARSLAAGVRAGSSGLNVTPQQIRHLPLAFRNAITTSVVHSLHTVYWVAVPFAALTFLLALMLRELRLREHSALYGAGSPESERVIPAGSEAGEPAAQ